MSKRGRYHNWIMRAAGILLCLVLASTHLVCGLFARYTTSASGSDSARVAKFQVTEAAVADATDLTQVISAELIPGVPFVAKTEVSNDSEVAICYEIKAKNLTGNLPLTFQVDGVAAEEEDGASVFADTMGPSTKKTYSLKILWTPEVGDNVMQDMGKVDQITVTLSATQVD